jgi:PIN domain nuclease of toxin-antitoxin system
VASLTHLDTHVVAWIAGGHHDRLSATAVEAVEHDILRVSPLVALELRYLVEAGRLDLDPVETLAELRRSLDLREAAESFGSVVDIAIGLTWTRDPFDRLIAAQAIAADARLLTKDDHLRSHLEGAFWS